MNIVQQTQHESKQEPATANIVAFRDYLTGMDLYDTMRHVTACENKHQEAGWWAALRADSAMAAMTEATL